MYKINTRHIICTNLTNLQYQQHNIITQLTIRKRYDVMDTTRRSVTSHVHMTCPVISSAPATLAVVLSNDALRFLKNFLLLAVVDVQHNPLPTPATRRLVKVTFVEACPRTMNPLLINQRVEGQEHPSNGHVLCRLNERQSRRAVPTPSTGTYMHHLQCLKGMISRS